jgi:hypothetical protein
VARSLLLWTAYGSGLQDRRLLTKGRSEGPNLIRCRIRPYMKSRRLRCALPPRRAQPWKAPPGARRASARRHLINRLITSAAQDAMHRHCSAGSVVAVRQPHPVNRRRQGYGVIGTGASSAPDCVALQSRPVKGS